MIFPLHSGIKVYLAPGVYNTPQKLDKGIRWMLACHTKKEARYGTKHEEEP